MKKISLIIITVFMFLGLYISIKPHQLSANYLKTDNVITFKILDTVEMNIDESRFQDGRLENRLELLELDKIFEAIKGEWQVGEYAGFLPQDMYYPALFGIENKRLIYPDEEVIMYQNLYEEKVEHAKNNIPQLNFSVNERLSKDINNNLIYTDGKFSSPVSVVISIDANSDYYPIHSDSARISDGFFNKNIYTYIKFFIMNQNEETQQFEGTPATLVLTSIGEYYILIDGAFYKVIEKQE